MYSQVNVYFSLYYLFLLRGFDLINILLGSEINSIAIISDVFHLIYYLEGFINMIRFLFIFRYRVVAYWAETS
jgi:hypothetical protein